MAGDQLSQAVGEVNVLDLAGRIISDPHRVVVSTAGVLALALALESAWSVAIEGELLARAIPEPAGDGAIDHAVKTQRHKVLSLMAAIRGEPTSNQEKNDGSSHS